jgi:phosphoribosylanthranilate isomerase
MSLLVKICGLTSPQDAEAAIEAGADLLGFIFAEGTPRALDHNTQTWIRELSGRGTVGVFRNAPLELVQSVRADLGLDWVQLHGNEPDEWLDSLGSNVLRWVPVGEAGPDWLRVDALAEKSLPLIDPGAGDGKICDWQALADGRPTEARFGLAGGLGPENVAEAVRLVRPALVDVSSGVESALRIKDHDRVRAFVQAARAAV